VTELAPETLILFGSHVWGHRDESSALDLLGLVPESDPPPPRGAGWTLSVAVARQSVLKRSFSHRFPVTLFRRSGLQRSYGPPIAIT